MRMVGLIILFLIFYFICVFHILLIVVESDEVHSL